MKSYFKYFFGFLFTLLVLVFAGFILLKIYDHKAEVERVRTNYDICPEEHALIEDGDILLRRGYGFVSDMIVRRLKEQVPVSHCAIVEKTDTTSRVIHSVSQTLADFDGVQTQSLERFIKDSKENSIIVVRYRYTQGQDASQVTGRARRYLEKKVPFDMKFDIQDTTRFYCTEFIWKVILEEFNIDIFEKKQDINSLDFYKFDVFLDPDYFDIVWSHQPL